MGMKWPREPWARNGRRLNDKQRQEFVDLFRDAADEYLHRIASKPILVNRVNISMNDCKMASQRSGPRTYLPENPSFQWTMAL